MIKILNFLKNGGWVSIPLVIATIAVMNWTVVAKKNKDIAKVENRLNEELKNVSELSSQLTTAIKKDSLKSEQILSLQSTIKEQVVKQRQTQSTVNFYKKQLVSCDTLTQNLAEKVPVIKLKYRWEKDPNGRGLFPGKTWVQVDSILTFGLKL